MNDFRNSSARLGPALALILWMTACSVAGAETSRYAVLHYFEKGSHDGATVESMQLLVRGQTIFGLTRSNGANSKGGLFSMNADGSGFRVLHNFIGGDADGHSPCGALIFDGSAFYGMTSHGGRGKGGVIFRANPDGADHTVIHHFMGWVYDGDTARGSLTLDGDFLYAMTARGGTNDFGVIFRIKKDGADFTLLHTFASGRGDGATPNGSLLMDGDSFYGMTSAGGQRNNGVIFRMSKDGASYSILHDFTNGLDDGSDPCGSLITDGTALYGTTSGGGNGDNGVIFRINKDGTGHRILHRFAGSGNDGVHPQSALTLVGSTLYGVTIGGGQNQAGVLFQINTSGTGFAVLHRFNDRLNPTLNDGAEPCGDLTCDGNFLYGMTRAGGDGGVVVFRYQHTVP